MTGLPRVALVATGGTIASQGRHGLDIQDYGASGLPMLTAADFLDRVPELARVAQMVPVPFSTLPSTAIGHAEWRALAARIAALAEEVPGLAGIVVSHGTSAMEETAYALSLLLPPGLVAALPVVLTGAQRPFTALSGDGPMNLVNAARVAGHPGARGLGVLVVMNDEVHAARDVTKTSNGRLDTFRSPAWGPLGVADGDAVVFHRRIAPWAPGLAPPEGPPPRVDILHSHAGSDGALVEACLALGAQGIVAAGFAPGFPAPAEVAALRAAAARGCAVVVSSRAGSGRVFPTSRGAEAGFIPAGDLNPQKARVLLQLALGAGADLRQAFAAA